MVCWDDNYQTYMSVSVTFRDGDNFLHSFYRSTSAKGHIMSCESQKFMLKNPLQT